MLYLNSDLSAFSPIHFNSTPLVRFQILTTQSRPPPLCVSLCFVSKKNQTKQNKRNQRKPIDLSLNLSLSLSLSLSQRGFFFDFHYPILYHSLTSNTSISSRYSLRNSQIQVSLAHLQAIESLNPDFIAFLHVLRFKSCSSH